ncbi:Rod shape-determining protein RodA [Thermodesulfovibrio sp. N1]|uniref:FtsW/RodA/SpoVE family cell cycle protein n=1 Tax=Thermodesulfovibrio sp. N1 TaxID=1871110 RepID=UPI000855825D|nr:Rod shape-determining protein RodA [Thermodesulfovibrio sp. N1]
MGAKRWINLGFFSFQPSEIFKIIFVISLSAYLSDKKSPLTIFESIKILIIFAFLPFILILKQPDLGTALIIVFITFIILIYKGIPTRLLIFFVCLALISVFFYGKFYGRD